MQVRKNYPFKIRQAQAAFVKYVNPSLNKTQINEIEIMMRYLVKKEKRDPDFVIFAIKWFGKYKPGKLHYAGGMKYIVRDKELIRAWEQYCKRETAQNLKAEMDKEKDRIQAEITLPNPVSNNKDTRLRFSKILNG